MRGLITMRKSAGGKFEMRESPAECGRIGNSAPCDPLETINSRFVITKKR